MSVDGNFVVLIHKQLLCRGTETWGVGLLEDDSRGDEVQHRCDGWLVAVTVGEGASGVRADDDSGCVCEEE